MAGPLHVQNARIWTGSPGAPDASAITIAGGRVLAVDGPPPPGATILDAGGRSVVPGLIDAHVHFMLGGKTLARLDLSGVSARSDFEAAIARRSTELAPGEWLLAGGWSEANWPGAALPEKTWLAAAGDRPVVCSRADLHAALVNDAVLARCDLDRIAPADESAWGGRIERDPATGEPTGLMVEAAAWELVNPLVPEATIEERQRAVLAAEAHVLRQGLTAVGSMEYWRDVEEVFGPLRDRMRVCCRVTLLDRTWPLDLDRAARFENDDRFAIIGSKAFIDGTFGSRSARMREDYDDDPGNRGLLVELARDGRLLDWIREVVSAGLSPSMHAIGDAAVGLALDVIEQVRVESPERAAAARFRIEHAQHVDPVDVARFRGVIASMQPRHKADDGRLARSRLGERRLGGTFAFRTLAEAGACLAFGSDWPVVTSDPLAGLRTAVTGLTVDGDVFQPGENLDVATALTAYTAGAARALGLDDAGVLAPGLRGDLVILDRDPFTADWVAQPPRVETTVVAGAVVWDRARAEPEECIA